MDDLDLAPPPAGSHGPTAAEAAERLGADGPNRIAGESRRDGIRRFLGPLADPMVVLLLVAAPIYFLVGETADGVVALLAIVPVAGVGWLLEARAERTLDQLARLTARTTVVWRDDRHSRIPAEQVVTGDLAWLHEGDIVPADARLIDLTQLHVDESALTGESLPVAKAVAGAGDDSMVFAGTTVVSGRAIASVTATGVHTRFGAIGALVGAARDTLTPLQRAVSKLVGRLALPAAVFCVAVVTAGLLHGHGWGESAIAGVSLAIAAIPEEFPLVYALYLALGARRLAGQSALVRRLPGVETLGSTTVICVDKTGTLTEGRVTVSALANVSGAIEATAPLSAAATVLIEAAVLACEPTPFDPMETAIAELALASGVPFPPPGTLVADHPFEPRDKYLSHVWRMLDGTSRVAAKGALEGILDRSGADAGTRRVALATHEQLAANGMRVLAVASGTLEGGPTSDRSRDEQPLELRGLIAFSDPLRAGVAAGLAECREAGVRVVMMTGDHPVTAHAVAESIDLPHTANGVDLIATGEDLDSADAAELDELVATTNVFARVRPEQKHLLVQALRRRGETVAMTGDGINDAPALREADIGVAMGGRGTDAARAAATIVLLDDNFSTIVSAVRNGRRILDNLAHAFAYVVAFHPPLLLAALVVPLVGRPLLLLPVHLVALELLLHPIVSLVFEADPPDADVMHRPPVPPERSLLSRELWWAGALGTTLAVVVVAMYLGALQRDWPVREARSLGFVTLLIGQPFLLIATRAASRPLWCGGLRPSRMLAGVVATLLAITLAAVYVSPLADLLKLSTLPVGAWALAAGAAAVTTLWREPLKRSRPALHAERGATSRSR